MYISKKEGKYAAARLAVILERYFFECAVAAQEIESWRISGGEVGEKHCVLPILSFDQLDINWPSLDSSLVSRVLGIVNKKKVSEVEILDCKVVAEMDSMPFDSDDKVQKKSWDAHITRGKEALTLANDLREKYSLKSLCSIDEQWILDFYEEACQKLIGK